MEFTKDIYFDNSLTAGKEVKITYSGNLFQNGSKNVNIVYGFGESWNNTTTKPMIKTENGFVANIRIREFDTFNFCFSDENNNWDNNNYFNYISPILPNVEEINENNEINFGTDYSTSIDDIIQDILGNTTKQDIINDKDNNSIDKILETINAEALPEIEALFNDLFFEAYKENKQVTSPISEISMDSSLAEELKEVGKNFENVIVPEVSNNPSFIQEIKDANETFKDLFVSTSETPVINTNKITNENTNLIELFNDLFETSNQPITFEIAQEEPIEVSSIQEIQNIDTPKLNVATFNLDGLVSDLLEPVITSETCAQKVSEDTSLFEDIKAHEEEDNNNESSLAIIDSKEFAVSSRKLSYFYKLRKKIRLAFFKLAKTSKNLVKQLGL